MALVSARVAGGAVLLFGASVRRSSSAQAVAERRTSSGGWMGVGSTRINEAGYFQIRAPVADRFDRGTYRVRVGREVSNAVRFPAVLQVISDRSRPGASEVELRLSPRARPDAKVRITRLVDCVSGTAVVAGDLSPGGELKVTLTATQGKGPAYYLASVAAGGRTSSVELIVPALPVVRLAPG